ncbi:MAG: hypothetical protein K2M62_04935 [Muribaculaceae bacterium]|nr:hypothetical protein [Muribaculaceae bacterium]
MKGLLALLISMLCLVPATAAAQNIEPADTVAAEKGMTEHYIDGEMLVRVPDEMTPATENPAEEGADDTPLNVVTSKDYHPYGLDGKREFNPDPTRAVWMSALFPGLGQVYNRRYWKLPIIVAGYMGLGYGTSWNARMFADYQLAYSDIMDDDPDTKSYLDFFPPTIDESTLDKSWLSQTLKSRKDYYRRNRDLCIICCVGVYLLCMLDAYVDASLSHFDISQDISMDVAPAVMYSPGHRQPTLGLNWAFTF